MGSLKKLQDRTVSPYITQVLGLDVERAARQKSISLAIAFFLHANNVPAVLAGTSSNGEVFPANHALTYGLNLFADSYVETQESADEPVVVVLLPDGTVPDFGSSRRAGNIQSIVRVEVRATTESYAQDCAWLLHRLFSQRGGFSSQYAVDGVCKTDLIVRGTKTLDEPAVVEVDQQSRVFMTFRILSIHSRI